MTVRKPLGQRLTDLGIITGSQLDMALKMQERTGEMLGEVLINLGFVTEEILSSALAAQSNVQQVDLERTYIENEVLKKVPEAFARRNRVIPLSLEDNVLTVAMENIFNVDVISDLERITGLQINVVAATESSIVSAVEISYTGGGTVDELIEESITLASDTSQKQEAIIEEAPIVKLVNQFIIKGIKDGSTDIHIEPEEKILRIRYRVDGVMLLGVTVPKTLQGAVIARLKIISGANIAETRVPQDGRIKFRIGRQEVDIRVSFFPTVNGENVVLRLLDKSKVVLGLSKLGISDDAVRTFSECIEKPYGMILVTGPTGSGKTTTLYSALSHLNSIEKNIITLEDPIEYEFPIIRQSQINTKINFTFAEGLKSILRQDPDIILVGEMRDKETVNMSIRSALTGHLVFSTLHTNNAVSTINRLADMDVEPFLISSTLLMVVAQRLIRKTCQFCREPVDPEEIRENYPSDIYDPSVTYYKGAGCGRCQHTGFSGRTGVYEFLKISPGIREMIDGGKSSSEIYTFARKEGFKTLLDDAKEKAAAGDVALSEVYKVAQGVF